MFKELYAYQKDDVNKLRNRLFSLDGSEMGTGKTHTAIELMQIWRDRVIERTNENLPILVITPINTFQSWYEKIAAQAPDLKVKIINRKNRSEFVDAIVSKEYDVYIMHWQAVRLVVPELNAKKCKFSVLIGDEAHALANRKAATTKHTKAIQRYHTHFMSGTASGDKPWNLWSLLNVLDSKAFSSYWKFVDAFAKQEVNYRQGGTYKVFTGVKNVEQLHKIMNYFYIRHTKMDKCCENHPNGVMPWLPPKNYEKLTVELNTTQRKIYKQMADQMVAWLQTTTGEREPLVAPIIVAKLIRLSQIALATPIIETNDEGEIDAVLLSMPSSKYAALLELINDYEDKQFVVFTSSKKMAYLCGQQLEKDGIANAVFSGDTPNARRQSMVNDFVSGKFRILVAVIEAAAEGIDGLQNACDTAIFLDRSWRTIKNKQAEDRLHRGGQKNPVTIIDIVAEDTLDEYRLNRLNDKWLSIQEVLTVGGFVKNDTTKN